MSDQIGQQYTESFTLTEPAPLQATYSAVLETYPGSADAQLQATPQGGTPPYQILWWNGSTANNLSGLSAGSYSLHVEGANGCSVTTPVNITTANTPVKLQPFVNLITCFGAADGAII